MRVLLCGWFSFEHGETTAGDVLSLEAVQGRLAQAGVASEVAWSPVMCPPGGMVLAQADPQDYSHLIFVCGPIHGRQLRYLHETFLGSRRIAVGVSVIDPADPAVTGFDSVIARDAPGQEPATDLAGGAQLAADQEHEPLPVLGIFLTVGQGEYGQRRAHEQVSATITGWLRGVRAARLELDTRLDPRDWRQPHTPDEVETIVRRLDVVITTRMHGLVLALKNGVPALALDPVAGGAKVSAQARTWGWPAILRPEGCTPQSLDTWLAWCLSRPGRLAAQRAARSVQPPAELDALLAELGAAPADLAGAAGSAGGA